MYNAPGWGKMSPSTRIHFFFRIINIQSYCPFPVRLSLYMTFSSSPSSNALVTYVDLAVKKVKVITGS